MTTVGFVKYGGIADVLEAGGPDELAVRLDELMCLVQREVDAEGLTFLNADADVDGGKVTMTAGVPVHKEDAEGRMLRAARRIVDAKPFLPISVGISRGALFSAHVGTETRSVYTVMGDAINLAARIASAAPYGSIYLSLGIAERSRTVFDVEELQPISVKGKTEPVRLLELGSERGQRPDPGDGDLPFAGREEALREIREAVDRLSGGRSSVIGIAGGAGTGKTRLLREALDATSDVPILVFRGEAFAADNPYWIFRDPLRRHVGIERGTEPQMVAGLEEFLRREAPGLSASAPLLGDLLHISVAETAFTKAIEPMFRPAQIANSLVGLLDATTDGPLIAVFEDHHWIDDASKAVLDRLVQAAVDRPWMVVATSREDLEEGRFDPLIELGPLTETEARALVIRGTEAMPLRPHELDSVVARAAGSPLFLTELVRRIRVSGDAVDLPESLEALVGTEIDRLEPEPRQVLRYASVLGKSFRRAVLLDLLHPDGLGLGPGEADALDPYLEPEDDTRLRFRNAFIRDVAYGGLSYRRRRMLHARAAAAIEERAGDSVNAVAEFLAVHSALAGDHSGAWRYSVVAGDKAREGYSNIEAATQYRRAIESASRLGDVPIDELVGVWSSLSRVLEEAGMLGEARGAIGSALRLARTDPVLRADLHLRRARTWMMSGSFANAKRNVTLGRKGLEPDRFADHLQASARLDSLAAGIAMYEGRPREALQAAERAALRATTAGDEDALARAYIAMDWAHHMLGQPEQATHGEQTLDLLQRLGHLKRASDVMNNEGGYAYFAGHWDDAVDWYRRSQETSEKAGNVIDAAFVRANIAEVMIGQRRFEEAAVELEEARRVLRAAGARPYLVFVDLQTARVEMQTGEPGSAVERLGAIHGALEESGDVIGSLDAAIHLADALVRSGEPGRAMEVLTGAGESAGDQGVMFAAALARVRSQALWALGDPGAAAARSEHGLQAARDAGLAYDEALLLDWQISMEEASGRTPSAESVRRRDDLERMLGIRPGQPGPVTRS
jgi:tetratricopeptide (TPR) repeat protein